MPPRLIPPAIALDTPSEGERVAFDALAAAEGADDWVVLHSLDLANHRRRLAGEIDFLLIVPGKGVLVLEVKGAHHLRRHDGLWFYGSDPRPDERGPFKQASEAMHSLRDRLVRRHRDLARVVFWSAVCFPFVDFAEASEEWHPWQVIDRRAMAARPLTQLCESVLDHAREELVAHDEPWFHAERHEPHGQQVDELLRVLRGDFEFFESPKSRARRLDDEVRRYTEEQFEALDTIDANPRVVFDGPAGTGKTLLAVEAARRGAVAGRRVLLLCFNRPLGRWLQEETEDLRPRAGAGVSGKGPGVVARTLHEHLRLLAGVTPTPEQVCSQSFWQDELPELAAEGLLELTERASRDGGHSREVYDEIVVDEAQDVLRRSYFDVLDLSLSGGFDGGIYRLFGDFAYQRIYDAAALSLDQVLAPGGPCAGAVRYELRVNCRNTPRVAQLACACGGVVPGYSRVRRPDDEAQPEIRYWRDEAGQRRLLAAVLDELAEQGFKGARTAILSPHGDDNCCARGLTGQPWQDRLAPLLREARAIANPVAGGAPDGAPRGDGPDGGAPGGGGPVAAGEWPAACVPSDLDAVDLHSNKTRYCSIYRFKGLESPAVVLTDIEDLDSPAACSLLYVGCTRALHRLVILAHESLRATLESGGQK